MASYLSMGSIFNLYCDESCHLPNDHQKTMVLGTIWCRQDAVKEITQKIKELKSKHGLKRNTEIKWTKVSPAKINLYSDLIDYFFDNKDLHFRALIVTDKNSLDHKAFSQGHDDWYYKMYFTLIKAILETTNKYRIYLDIKDTQGRTKIKKLHDVLSNSIYDFDKTIVEKLQLIRSHDSAILQLTDLFVGALSHFQRSNSTSKAKADLIQKIQKKSGFSLKQSTLLRENKLNLFFWDPHSKNE